MNLIETIMLEYIQENLIILCYILWDLGFDPREGEVCQRVKKLLQCEQNLNPTFSEVAKKIFG